MRPTLILVLAMTCGTSTVAAAQWSVAGYLGDASLTRGALRVTSPQDDTAVRLTIGREPATFAVMPFAAPGGGGVTFTMVGKR